MVSIIGTTIWGSSSFGVLRMAKKPKEIETRMRIGVSLESMK